MPLAAVSPASPAGMARASRLACAHCGLDVPAGSASSYCCDGCRVVAEALAANGLEQWYELRERSGVAATPARTTGRRYEELDEEAFASRNVRTDARGRAAIDFYLEGVHCAACVWLVERLGRIVPGVLDARLDFARSRASIAFDPAVVTPSAIARRLDSLGYPVHPWREADRDAARRREDARLALRLGVAGACAMNAMMLAAAIYAGARTDMEPAMTGLLRFASLVVSLPAALWSALPFYRGAWGALKARVLHVDLPLSIAIVAAFGGSAWHVLRGAGDVYFDSLTALVFLLLVARWLNRRAARGAENAAGVLAALAPSSARRVDEHGVARDVPIDALRPGERVEVLAGASLPADGVIEEGRTAVDLSLLSGESRPLARAVGDVVHAGTVNVEARIVVRVTSAGESTRLGRLAALVEDAIARRAPVMRLVDRLSGSFVAIVLALSALTLAAWWPIDPSRALENALAMLIVTCPCVLAYATPLAINAALGRAARRGLLVKGGDALEAIGRPGVVLLDKTGTLTRGEHALVSWLDGSGGAADSRGLACALAAQSAHPLARALAAGLEDRGLVARDVEQVVGAGLRGTVDGRAACIGSRRHVEAALGVALPKWSCEEIERLAELAITPVIVAVDGRVAAVAGVGDPVREDARALVRDLRARGWDVRIASGDEPAVVAAVAREIGLPREHAAGGVSPEGKVETVRALRAGGRAVLMVGDGVNDAAALAAADVGLAVQGGAEASLAAADAFATRPGLAPVLELVDGARGLRRALRVNAAIGIGYNAIGAGLCLAGLIGPLGAALLMPASSLMVTAVSLLWPTFPRRGVAWR